MNLKYYGTFRSRNNVLWRVEIHTTASVAASEEVRFPGDEPLVIEWPTTDKVTPIQSSVATLKLLSESDRKFIGLYSVEPGAVLLTVYREGSLYWRGSLDTEIYEEPYSWARDYEVSLTFSDFGLLQRLKYTGSGCVTLQSLIEGCVTSAKVLTSAELPTLLETHISTAGPVCGYSSPGLGMLSMLANTARFHDDDGEGQTLEEVLNAVLQPLALQVKQKGGKVHVFDINSLMSLTADQVSWQSDDAVLSADKVYNNVCVTFSPDDDQELLSGEVEGDDSLNPSTGGAVVHVDYHKNSSGACDSGTGFRFHKNTALESDIELGTGVEYFQIVPVYSGTAETGVFWGRRSGDTGMSDGTTTVVGNAPAGVFSGNDEDAECTSRMIMKLPKALLNYTSIDRSKYSLRISLRMLFDVRYNPFESEGDNNEKGNWEKLQNWVNFAYVPFRLIVYDASGAALYHYENKGMMLSSSYSLRSTNCKWVAGAGAWGDAFLSWYDWEDRKSASGCGGWQGNKPIIGYYRGDLPSAWGKRDDGDYIDLPPVGGYLELQIGSGVHQFDYNREVKDIYSKIRWVMYKEPKLTLCYSNGIEVESSDIVDEAYLSASAKESLEVETVLGTPPGTFGLPTARGLILSPSFAALTTATRGGVTARLERLLIGTIYSQYASRKMVLSGTAAICPSFAVHSDASASGKKFMMLGEVQDMQADESEITMAEIAADNYEGVESNG